MTTCKHCLSLARVYAVENFYLDRGFDGQDLPFSWDDDGKTPAWADVTAETSFQAWGRLMDDVAVGYLANGDVACHCDDV